MMATPKIAKAKKPSKRKQYTDKTRLRSMIVNEEEAWGVFHQLLWAGKPAPDIPVRKFDKDVDPPPPSPWPSRSERKATSTWHKLITKLTSKDTREDAAPAEKKVKRKKPRTQKVYGLEHKGHEDFTPTACITGTRRKPDAVHLDRHPVRDYRLTKRAILRRLKTDEMAEAVAAKKVKREKRHDDMDYIAKMQDKVERRLAAKAKKRQPGPRHGTLPSVFVAAA